MDATVLSVPRTGTHFVLYLLMIRASLNITFDHIGVSSAYHRINKLIDEQPDDYPVIVVTGNEQHVIDTFGDEVAGYFFDMRDDLMPRLQAHSGTVFIDVEKRTGFTDVLTKLGLARTSQITTFETAWPHISHTEVSSMRDELYAAITDSNRLSNFY